MNKKGITLVALVVTIIVLLILAGITIALVLGDDGIVKKAQKGGAKQQLNVAGESLQSAGFGLVSDYLVDPEFKAAVKDQSTALTKIKEELKKSVSSDYHALVDTGTITQSGESTVFTITKTEGDLTLTYTLDFDKIKSAYEVK